MLSAELLIPAVSVFLFPSQAHRTWRLHLIFHNPSSAKAITTCTLSATQKASLLPPWNLVTPFPWFSPPWHLITYFLWLFRSTLSGLWFLCLFFFSVLLWNYLLFTNINIPRIWSCPSYFYSISPRQYSDFVIDTYVGSEVCCREQLFATW